MIEFYQSYIIMIDRESLCAVLFCLTLFGNGCASGQSLPKNKSGSVDNVAKAQTQTIGSDKLSRQVSNSDIESVRSKLAVMVGKDQEARQLLKGIPSPAMTKGKPSKEFLGAWKHIRAVDMSNSLELKQIIDTYGWVEKGVFGEEAENHAWLLVQHMVYDKGVFQQEILSLTKPLIENGRSSIRHYSRLLDRVNVIFRKEEQYFGTQGKCTVSGVWEPSPIKAPHLINERRQQVGLSSFEDLQKRMNEGCQKRLKK